MSLPVNVCSFQLACNHDKSYIDFFVVSHGDKLNVIVQCHKGAIEYAFQFVLLSYKLMADPYRF